MSESHQQINDTMPSRPQGRMQNLDLLYDDYEQDNGREQKNSESRGYRYAREAVYYDEHKLHLNSSHLAQGTSKGSNP